MNPGSTAAPVNVNLYAATGARLVSKALTVSAGSQTAFLISDFSGPVTTPGWVSVTSDVSGLQAFWLGGDFSTFTDGATSAPTGYYAAFSLVTDQTEMSVVNLAGSSDLLDLYLLDSDGNVAVHQFAVVPPNGCLQGTPAQLFNGAVVDPLQQVSVVISGAAGRSLLAGTSVTRGFLAPVDSVVVNGLLKTSTNLQIPYVVEGAAGGSRYSTDIGVMNLGNSPAQITLTLNLTDGAPLTIQRSLESFGSFRATISQLFGVTGRGWVQISTTNPVTAWAAYADTVGGGASIVPADNTSSTGMILAHIANGDPWLTGVALVNPTNQVANVEVYAIAQSGALIDGPATSPAASFSLGAKALQTSLLGELLPATRGVNSGFVLIRSTNGVPLLSLELFFLTNGRVFANVPASPTAFTPPPATRFSQAALFEKRP